MAVLGKVESAEDRLTLLGVARAVVEKVVGTPVSEMEQVRRIEGTFGGAFVTLWVRNMLRGCVGSFVATSDICQTIQEVTRSSLADPRFASRCIRALELDDLNIEISVLSALQRTDEPLSLVPGTHGVMVRRGLKSGCFLPKVATDRGWSAAEFLSECCTMKAGLAANAWREPDAEVLLFTADVFAEKRPCRS